MTMHVIVSLKHTRPWDPYITLWQVNNKGFTFECDLAGRYGGNQVATHARYYNDDVDNLAVPDISLNPLWVDADAATLGHVGRVLPNTPEVWRQIKANRANPTPLRAPIRPIDESTREPAKVTPYNEPNI